jgi:metal-sulfur cluster biosynthetic enzyme
LGIVHEVELKKDVVMVLMKFPFQGVPIGEQLIQSIRNAIHYLDLKTEIVVTLMDQNELQKFLSLEEKYWKG